MNNDVVAVLRSSGPLPAAELAARLRVSRPTLSRLVRAAGDDLITLGSARRTGYGARRALRGALAPLPIYRIGLDGLPVEVTRLALVHPQGCAVNHPGATGWPLDDSMRDGWFEGLPYFLQDMRPQGFLGRNFARQHAAVLQVGEDPGTWSDDDVLHVLSLLGADTSGDLLIGDTACRLWLEQVQAVKSGQAPAGLSDEQVGDAYAALALAALSQGIAGSSAGGEFPKFTAVRRLAAGTDQHVLVKFSGADDSPGTRRWSDLLVCEHLASQVIQAALGLAAAPSRILTAGGRTFLEVDRFDRHGALGRSPVVSWFSLNAAVLGTVGRPWPEAVSALLPLRWITARDVEAARTLWHFGQLIGNTDMHDGNLSFVPTTDSRSPGLTLAPVYDMLPMGYAPVRGVELPPWRYTPRLPLPADMPAWTTAAQAALRFWEAAAADPRISDDFRHLCGDNSRTLDLVMR